MVAATKYTLLDFRCQRLTAALEAPPSFIRTVDLAKVDVTRTHWPFLRDRRIDAYAGLTKRLLD